jgi:hypothetical protein
MGRRPVGQVPGPDAGLESSRIYPGIEALAEGEPGRLKGGKFSPFVKPLIRMGRQTFLKNLIPLPLFDCYCVMIELNELY